MGLFDGRPKIFKNRNVVSPIFVPDTLQDREHEVKEISQYLGCLFEDATPPHFIIVGPPGCGKTVSVKMCSTSSSSTLRCWSITSSPMGPPTK